MSALVLQDLEKTLGAQEILGGVNLHMEYGERGSAWGATARAELLARLERHPEATGGPKLPLASQGQTGKVCVVFEDQ